MRPIAASTCLVLLLGACAFPDSMLWRAAPASAQPPAPPVASAAPQPAAPAPRPAPVETRHPFVVIRFEAPDPDYAPSLYEALKGALARKPNVGFDLVAVTRNADDAQRNLASVYRTVTDMGMPADRLSLSAVAAADDRTDEVWIYVR